MPREKSDVFLGVEFLLKMLNRSFSEAVSCCCCGMQLEKIHENRVFRDDDCWFPEAIELFLRTWCNSDEGFDVCLVALLLDGNYLLFRVIRDCLFVHVVEASSRDPHSEDEVFHVVVDVVLDIFCI